MNWHTDKLTNHTVLLAPVHRLVKDGNVLAKIVERNGVCECTVFHGMDIHKTFDTDKHTVHHCQIWCVDNLAKYDAPKWFTYKQPQEKGQVVTQGKRVAVIAINEQTGASTLYKNRQLCSNSTGVSTSAIVKYTDRPTAFKGYYFRSPTQ